MLDRSHEQRIRAQQLSSSTEITLPQADNEELAAHIEINGQLESLQVRIKQGGQPAHCLSGYK